MTFIIYINIYLLNDLPNSSAKITRLRKPLTETWNSSILVYTIASYNYCCTITRRLLLSFFPDGVMEAMLLLLHTNCILCEHASSRAVDDVYTHTTYIVEDGRFELYSKTTIA